MGSHLDHFADNLNAVSILLHPPNLQLLFKSICEFD